MKAQAVRVVDVLALGPFMIWAGVKATDLPLLARWALVLSGGATVVYNGINFAQVQDRQNRTHK